MTRLAARQGEKGLDETAVPNQNVTALRSASHGPVRELREGGHVGNLDRTELSNGALQLEPGESSCHLPETNVAGTAGDELSLELGRKVDAVDVLAEGLAPQDHFLLLPVPHGQQEVRVRANSSQGFPLVQVVELARGKAPLRAALQHLIDPQARVLVDVHVRGPPVSHQGWLHPLTNADVLPAGVNVKAANAATVKARQVQPRPDAVLVQDEKLSGGVDQNVLLHEHSVVPLDGVKPKALLQRQPGDVRAGNGLIKVELRALVVPIGEVPVVREAGLRPVALGALLLLLLLLLGQLLSSCLGPGCGLDLDGRGLLLGELVLGIRRHFWLCIASGLPGLILFLSFLCTTTLFWFRNALLRFCLLRFYLLRSRIDLLGSGLWFGFWFWCGCVPLFLDWLLCLRLSRRRSFFHLLLSLSRSFLSFLLGPLQLKLLLGQGNRSDRRALALLGHRDRIDPLSGLGVGHGDHSIKGLRGSPPSRLPWRARCVLSCFKVLERASERKFWRPTAP